jgi:folate-binding protein YgfZ
MLPDRGVVRVVGEDAEKLLQGVITNDMALLARQPAIHAALLSPQGKMLFEFFVAREGSGFLLETATSQAAALAKRLSMYRLRAKATIADVSSLFATVVSWGTPNAAPPDERAISFVDPRLAELGTRMLMPVPGRATGSVAADAYHAHRVALGVPEGGKDYALGDAFPHEADLDQLHGVSFTKGCFIGQEVVSRMQNRGTVRKRVVPVTGEAPLTPGAEIAAGAAMIGTIGSVAGERGLALVRLDRAAEAKAKGQSLLAAGVAITLRKPRWATFELAPVVAPGTP